MPANSPDQIRLAVDCAAALLSARIPLPIACGAGLSRSPVVAAPAWARIHRLTLGDAQSDLTRSLPHDVSPALWNDVLAATQSIVRRVRRELVPLSLRTDRPD